MVRKVIDHNELDLHAQKREIKLHKKHHLPDNRKSIQIIAKLSATPKKNKKSSLR